MSKSDMRTLVFVLLTSLTISRGWAAEFYVSTNGSDDYPGTNTQPFATLQRARDAIRVLKAGNALTEPVTVFVRQGNYALGNTLTLGSQDSGTEAAPIVYRACENEKPLLVGGREIKGFTPHRDELLKADVKTLELTGAGARVLTCDGQRQQIARYPNSNPKAVGGGDWAYVDGTRYSMYADSPDEDNYLQQNQHLDFWQRNIPRLTQTLVMKPQNVRPWRQPEQAEVSIFPRFNWEHSLLKVKSFDSAKPQLLLESGCYYEIRPGDRYFVRGLFEELDSPGEWYLDREADILYFWPPSPLAGKAVHLAALTHLIELNNCAYVTVRGFTMECCDGTAVLLKDCTDCLVAGNTIRNVGDVDGCGVMIEGGRRIGVVGNDIYDVGSDGVRVTAGDVISLSPAEIRIDNNYIHHVGLIKRDAKGVALTLGFRDGRGIGQCAGIRITHNLIHDTPQSGIFLWGSQHTIEYNHIRHTCTESEDTGAIGGGAIDWLSWLDTVIRYNYIHDTLGYGYDTQTDKWVSPYFTAALYPDWAASGVTMVGNVLVRAPRACLFLHSGRDNVIENNILIDGGLTQMHWRGWTTEEGFWSTMVAGWIKNYEQARQHAAWRDVPALKDPRRVPLPDHRVMTGNVFRRNIIDYTDPRAALFTMETVPLEHNQSDFNVIHHAGQPLRTGVTAAKTESGPNLLINAGLEEGEVGKAPTGWSTAAFPDDGTRVRVVNDPTHEGTLAAMIEPARTAEQTTSAKTVYLTLGSVPFQPGKAYRLSLWMKSEGELTPVALSVFSWKKGEHSWDVQSTAALTPEWRQYELLFRLPNEGDREYKSSMDTLMWRINFPQGSGSFRLDDASLREADLTDEWEGWQAAGMDEHSIVADPLFVDPAQDDYRLQPASPALKLGFQPIPFDQIGPYQDTFRASWPIVEAPGAREAQAAK
jgi:hypothetical protein